MDINYCLANEILKEAYTKLERISCKTDINKADYKDTFDIIENTILNLNVILNEADIVNDTYCDIENIITFLNDKKKQF